ncbi:endonuclease domain-containing protein [Streptomyces sp. NPDC057596]|uniref:endonuclease domain-containing protein n=1 Tax=Streptomyces sp. NPDC057596 TaxID=3346178 RepID=UPI00367CE70E
MASVTRDYTCGRPTKKGTPCRRELHSWLEGLKVRRADGCWRHMDPALREAAERRKQQDEAAWQAYLAASPICWSWPIPTDLENWTYQQGEDINEQLSPEALDMLMGNPESRADGILRGWQDGRCAICGHRYSLVEDHDHVTGLTRGYLCRRCNIQEGVHRYGTNLFSRYRDRHPTKMLGLRIRYWDPFTGDYARPLDQAAGDDKWTDAASEDIGL